MSDESTTTIVSEHLERLPMVQRLLLMHLGGKLVLTQREQGVMQQHFELFCMHQGFPEIWIGDPDMHKTTVAFIKDRIAWLRKVIKKQEPVNSSFVAFYGGLEALTHHFLPK